MNQNLNEQDLQQNEEILHNQDSAIVEPEVSTGSKILKGILLLISGVILFFFSQLPMLMEIGKSALMNDNYSSVPAAFNFDPNEFKILGEAIRDNIVVFDIVSIIIAIIPLAIMMLIYKKTCTMKTEKITKKILIRTLIAFVAMYALNAVTGLLYAYFNGSSTSNNEIIANVVGQVRTLPIVLIIGLYTPIAEELIFRGFLFEIFSFKNMYIPLVISSVIFAALHMQNLDPFAFCIYLGMGLIFGFAYMKTKNIYVPIILHILNNTLAALAMAFLN